jgi:class 3 adenylate cyclase
MGVHTGEPRVREGEYWGPDVHYAARVASAARGGQVLVSAATAALTGTAGLTSLVLTRARRRSTCCAPISRALRRRLSAVIAM